MRNRRVQPLACCLAGLLGLLVTVGQAAAEPWDGDPARRAGFETNDALCERTRLRTGMEDGGQSTPDRALSYPCDAPDGGCLRPVGFYSQPKVINVARERLDRRPFGPGSASVLFIGGSKIIRVASSQGPSAGRKATATSSKHRAGALAAQPWSPRWLRYCRETHPSFDPTLGTYVAGDGIIRFCTAGE